MDFFVRDDLVKIGIGEDGEDEIGIRYSVVFRNDRGEQWAHNLVTFNVTKRYDAEEGCNFFRRDNGEAKARIEAMCQRMIDAKRPIVERYWTEIEPAYGSDAYQEIDAIGGHRYAELRAAEDRGELPIGSAERMAYA